MLLDEAEQPARLVRRDRQTRPARSEKNSLCCALLKCASFFYLKMCITVSCSARATSAWWPAAGLVPARLPPSRRAQAHSGGAGPGAPAHGQVDVDGHVQQRQAVATGAASKRPDRVVLRSYRLRAVLGLRGGGKAGGVSSLNGESSTLRGLLGTHVQAPGRSAGG